MKPSFERFVEGCWEMAKDLAMRKKDDVPFTFVARDSNNRIHFLSTIKYPDKRDFYATILFGYCHTYDVRMYAVMSSAWSRSITIPNGLSEGERQKLKDSIKRPSESPDRIEVLTMMARSENFIHLSSLEVFTAPTYHLGPRKDGHGPRTIARGHPDFDETVRDSRLLNLSDFKVVPVLSPLAVLMSPEALKPFFDLIVIAAPEIEKFFHPSDN